MQFEDFLQHQHPFLTGFCESHLRTLASQAAHVHFPAGTSIFHEGEPAEHLYLVQRGKVVIQVRSAGHPVPVETIGDGEVLGWSWLFPPYCWHFDAVAGADTDAISIPAAAVRADCEADKVYGYALMKQVAELLIHRLQAVRASLVHAHKEMA